MKFLVDNQLPAALARYIATQGHDCDHVLEMGLGQSSDAEIYRHAEQNGATLISKDEDFFFLATRPGARLSLVWVRIRNCRKASLLQAFERAWPGIVEALSTGERIVEIR
ncbi:MAG TPA: DUF5615 family PIN-like protein [Gemmataceae bacterium]|nr:DUF5615 family PIN-like protein [Bryobacteraceae bacterium]HZV04191.1 DUF5615 family PIN-like protein [Gemmataceae bacterium]